MILLQTVVCDSGIIVQDAKTFLKCYALRNG